MSNDQNSVTPTIDNKTFNLFLTLLAGLSIAFMPGVDHGGQLPVLCLFLIAPFLLFNRSVWKNVNQPLFMVLVFFFLAAFPLAINSQEGEPLDVPSRYFIASVIFLALYRVNLNYGWIFKFTLLAVVIAFVTSLTDNSTRLRFGIGIIESGAILSTLSFMLAALGYYSQKTAFRILAATISIVCIFLLIKTGARGGWVSLLGTSIIVSYFMYGKHHKLKYTASLLLLSIVLSVAYVNSPIINTRVNAVISDLNKFSDRSVNTSVGQRLTIWELSVEGFLQSPVYGLSYKEIAQLRASYFDKYNLNLSGSEDGRASSHSDIFNSMLKQGSIGLIALFLLYIVPLRYYLKRYNQNTSPQIKMYSIMGITLVISTFISGLTEAVLMHGSVATFYAVTLVLLYHAIRQQEQLINHQETT